MTDSKPVSLFNSTQNSQVFNLNEEQTNELMALEAIYDTKFQQLDSNSFRIQQEGYLATFTYPSGYPEELPTFEIEVQPEETTEDDPELVEILQDPETQSKLETFIFTTCEENLGGAMIFTVIEATTEYLQDLKQKQHNDKQIQIEQEKNIQEENERKKFLGTPVTIENFNNWNQGFLKEMYEKEKQAELLLQQQQGVSDSNNNNKSNKQQKKCKLTGRLQFEKDTNLVKSDIVLRNTTSSSKKSNKNNDDDVEVVDMDFYDDIEGLDLDDDDDDNSDNENQVLQFSDDDED